MASTSHKLGGCYGYTARRVNAWNEGEDFVIPVRKIGYATFETPDLPRLLDYYTGVIGLVVIARDANRTVLGTEAGEQAIVLERGVAAQCKRLSLQIDATFDMKDAERKLAEVGLKSERRSNETPCVSEVLAFQDPSGTTIELFSERTLARTDVSQTGISPLKLGHTAFTVPDAHKMVDFYTQVLGFRVSDWLLDVFAFLRCGPDHHTVNFVAGEHTRIHHAAFELKNASHLLAACDVLGRKNMQIIWGPGRHGIGHNIFVYHRDPDDHIIEFYIEMDQMVDESSGCFEPRAWHKDTPQRPKVWERVPAALTWGTPPTPEFLRTHFKNSEF